MPTGKLKWFNTEKNYGFIAPADGSSDVFVHRKGFLDASISGEKTSPNAGDQVEYTITEKNGKVSATHVVVVAVAEQRKRNFQNNSKERHQSRPSYSEKKHPLDRISERTYYSRDAWDKAFDSAWRKMRG